MSLIVKKSNTKPIRVKTPKSQKVPALPNPESKRGPVTMDIISTESHKDMVPRERPVSEHTCPKYTNVNDPYVTWYVKRNS